MIAEEAVKAKIEDYRSALDNGQHVVKSLVKEPNNELFVDWRPTWATPGPLATTPASS